MKSRYGVYVILLSSLAAVVLSVSVNILLLQRSARMSEKARIAADRRECVKTAAFLDAYRETPPSTPTGRNIVSVYEDQYAILRCEVLLTK